MVAQNLRQMASFASFSDEKIAYLEQEGKQVELDEGAILFREGDAAQGLYIILEGELEIIKQVSGRSVVLANVPQGSFVGEISLLTGIPHTATARTTMPSRFLKYDAKLFDTIRESPLTQLILLTMVQRLRDTESQVQQDEKLSALGKMAAGLAHELNNPASANLRAATQLPETLALLQTQTLNLYAADLSGEQLAFLMELQSQLIDRATTTPDLDPLALSDLEDALMIWCDDAGVAESWRIAPILASAGVSTDELGRIRTMLGAEVFPSALDWLESTLTIAALAGTLQRSAARVSKLIEAVKAYTYMDQAPEQELDIHDGLESTLIVLQHKLNGIDINRVYDRTLPRITAHGTELNQVWTILLGNAADAIADVQRRGSICVRTSRENNYLCVEIADDGSGIPADLHSRLFEPFFTTKAVGQGAGLGLSIARRIVVERHQGMINVDSRPGDTRFRVLLPLGGM